MGSTPEASGSSVPAWPIRRVPVRRRMRPTMSWLVGPTGLSRLTTPSIGAVELTLGFGEEPRLRLGQRRVDRAPGRPRMATATEGGGDRHGVGPRRRAHADARVRGVD